MSREKADSFLSQSQQLIDFGRKCEHNYDYCILRKFMGRVSQPKRQHSVFVPLAMDTKQYYKIRI